ncbi:hypothetical protein Tco_1504672 [Tanacetum coccineum]
MESVKKSIDEKSQHKREYDSRVNDRLMQTTDEKVDSSKELDANIIPIYDEEPMVEVQMTAEINVFATRQQHTEQPEFNNEGAVDQNANQCHDKCPLPAKLTDNQKTELSYKSLESKNICIIELYFVRTEYQLADMFTKALPEDRFQYLVRRIGMRCLTPAELEVLANESA